jgi:hypothetical protein
MGLKVITSRFPTMASPAYKISFKSTKRLKRFFIRQVRNGFRSLLLYNKLQSLVSVVALLLFVLFLPYSKVSALVSMVTSVKDCMWFNHRNQRVLNNPNPLLSKAERSRHCIHLRSLNPNNFKVVEAMHLKLPHRGPLQCHFLTIFLPNLLTTICIFNQLTPLQFLLSLHVSVLIGPSSGDFYISKL